MAAHPQLIVLIGPSGAGKSSVAKILCNRYGFQLEKTVTTRPQRDEFDTDQVFVTLGTFNALLSKKAFFGTLEAFGSTYGLPRFNPEKPTVLLLRAPVIHEFLTGFPDARVIQIEAPLSVLKEHLEQRNSQERIDDAFLTKEIALGRQLTSEQFDSSELTAEEIAERICKITI